METSVSIHPTAVVSGSAKLGVGVRIGPYCIVDGTAVIGDRSELQSHVCIRGDTQIGENAKIFPFAVIGAEPQHLKYAGEPTRVVIGKNVTIRESATVHRGTTFGDGVTQISDDCYLMAYSHVAHDCVVGRSVIMANGAQLAGHVTVGDFANIGGLSAIQQFCRIGEYCFIGGCSGIRRDVPPYVTGKGADFQAQGINVIGMRRRGLSEAAISDVTEIYKLFFMSHKTVADAIAEARAQFPDSPAAITMLNFIATTKIGIVRPAD